MLNSTSTAKVYWKKLIIIKEDDTNTREAK